MSEEQKRRGRPRPLGAVRRDDAVFELLSDRIPRTRNEVAAALSISVDDAYRSLDRLRDAGHAKLMDQRGFRKHWTLA